MPRTRSCGSTTASSSTPILQVPTGCWVMPPRSRIYASRSARDLHCGPGESSLRRDRPVARAVDVARGLDAANRGLDIGWMSEGVQVYTRRIARVARAQRHAAARFRMQHHGIGGDEMLLALADHRQPDLRVHAHRVAHDLDIRLRKIRLRADHDIAAIESASRTRRCRTATMRTATTARDPRATRSETTRACSPRTRQARAQCSERFAPTPGRSCTGLMPMLPQMIGGPDAGEHQQLRRVVRAAAQDHLAIGAALCVCPPRRTRLRLRAGIRSARASPSPADQLQIRPMRTGCRYARAVFARRPRRSTVISPRAKPSCARVQIVVGPKPAAAAVCISGSCSSLAVSIARPASARRRRGTARRRASSTPALEVRQYVGETPALAARDRASRRNRAEWPRMKNMPLIDEGRRERARAESAATAH